jgi:GT2 family glycosyltransferase
MENRRIDPDVFVLLLNWNGWRDTIKCLNSLKGLDYPCFRVVVVDNGSTDNSLTQIRAAFPSIALIEAGKNLGFAGGCNLGIKYALRQKAQYVWLLNNDTEVDPQALRALVETAEADTRIGAVGSAIYSMTEPEQLQAWGGGHVNFWLGRSRHFVSPVADEQIQFLTAASLLIRSSVVQSIGFLDEAFFMYWEDADYCFRLRQAGWGLAVAGSSKVRHKEQGSVGKNSALLDGFFNRSATRFFTRHASIPFISIWAGVGLRILKRVILGDWKRVRAVWRGAGFSESSAAGEGS